MPSSFKQIVYAEPGITRDGTPFDATTYIAGQQVRFYKRKPQKIGGFLMLNKGTQQIPRGLLLNQNQTVSSDTDIYVGYQGYAPALVSQNVSLSRNTTSSTPDRVSLDVQVSTTVSLPFRVTITGTNGDTPVTYSRNITSVSSTTIVTPDQPELKYTSVSFITIGVFSVASGSGDRVVVAQTYFKASPSISLIEPQSQSFLPKFTTNNGAVLVYQLNRPTNTALANFVDRTPITGPPYVADPFNVWTFATIQGSDTQGALSLSLNPSVAPLTSPSPVKVTLTIGSNVILPVYVVITGFASVANVVTPLTETLTFNTAGTAVTQTTKNKFTTVTSAVILSISSSSNFNNTVTATSIVFTDPASSNLLSPTTQSVSAGDPTYQGASLILAHVAPTANNPSSMYTGPQGNSVGQIYYGIAQNYQLLSQAPFNYIPLVPVMQNGTPYSSGRTDFQTADNGICVIGNYIFALGNNGVVKWNTATPFTSVNNPFLTQNCVNYWNPDSYFAIGSEDFIYGAPVRVGGELGGLFWTSTSLVRASRVAIPAAAAPTSVANNTQDPGLYTWTASYVSTITTCISARSITSYDPFFFWVGSDCFYQYNGAVLEVPNETNKIWFFDNLNRAYVGKVTSFVNVQYHEWWILFPKGNSVENNWALVYNIDYQCWFDTPWDRSCAFRSSQSYNYPIMTSSAPDIYANGNYPIFAHEYGYDANYGTGESFSIFSSLPTPSLQNGVPLPLNPLLPSQFSPKTLNFTMSFASSSADKPIQLQILGNDSQTIDRLTFTKANPKQQTKNIFTSIQKITPLISSNVLPFSVGSSELPAGYIFISKNITEAKFPAQPLTFTIDFGNPPLESIIFNIIGTDQSDQPINYVFTCTPTSTRTTPQKFTRITQIFVRGVGSSSMTTNNSGYPMINGSNLPSSFFLSFFTPPSADQPFTFLSNDGGFGFIPTVHGFSGKFFPYFFNTPTAPSVTIAGKGLCYISVFNNKEGGGYDTDTIFIEFDSSAYTTKALPKKYNGISNIQFLNTTAKPTDPRIPRIIKISDIVLDLTSGQITNASNVSILNNYPIQSSFTLLVSQEANPPHAENPLILEKVTLDFVKTGDMTLTVQKLAYPNSPTPYASTTFTFSETDAFLTTNEKGTLLLLTFASNTLGGSYLLGKTILRLTVLDTEREEPI